ncbi:MAG TPA: MBL fold metallo-hydrolase [Terriglobales bacterium]|nr:MBL fold metallo-hydrolase [Terriglobales bacterium]
MVSVTVLASGSKGNCTVVSSSRTKILVDAGLSARETFRRLEMVGDSAHSLSAIVISHEHCDHVAGLCVLAKKLRIPVYMTGLAHQAYERAERDKQNEETGKVLERCEIFQAGHGFHIGDIAVMPFTIPHDAADPVAFTFKVEGVKVGVVTDLGYMPHSVVQHMRGCDMLMIESNHDLEMLRIGPYPWSVKQRVMSRLGHLSNDALAEFFRSEYDGGAAFVVLAHLSEHNNHPELARTAAEHALSSRRSLLQNRLVLASQEHPLEPLRF